jgi:DNA-binding transcriptional LysR family regulator
MDLRHLRYFVALAEELHFGRAALRLSITQPPLSFAIRALEQDIGAQLFVRDNKRVSLTDAGRVYLLEARSILDRMDHANETARSIALGKLGRIEIGFTGSMVYREVPDLISRFQARHPKIDVALREMASVEQVEAVLHGQLHAAFVNLPFIPEGLQGLALRKDVFVCCLPEDHALAEKPEIDLIELAGDPFIMFMRDISPVNYDNVINVCRQAGFEPETRFAARQWLTIVALVANGLGVSLVPRSVARSRIAGARFVPIRGAGAFSSAYLLWQSDNRSPSLRHFIEMAAVALAPAQPV